MADARPAPLRRLYRQWLIRPFVFVCLTSLGFALSGCAQEVAPVRTARTLVLNDAQMDGVTAGAGNVTLNLHATATGADATTSTSGSVQTARATILRVAPTPVGMQLIGTDPVDLTLAAGQAQASGDGGAACSATIVATINPSFLLLQASGARITATSALCSCAAFAIAPVAR